jgi:hypothetical protein
MTFTVQNVWDRALARSIENEADLLSETEVINILSDKQRELFILAAVENPDYFGTSTTLSRGAFTGVWDITSHRPGTISKLEILTIVGTVTDRSVGEEVNLVAFRFQSLGLAPRVYLRGRKLTDFGDLNTDVSNYVSQLTMYYSPVPAALTAVGSIISLPEEWVNLLVVPLAKWMAIRDGGRDNEVKQLDGEYGMVLGTFLMAIKLMDYTAQRAATAISAADTLATPGAPTNAPQGPQ